MEQIPCTLLFSGNFFTYSELSYSSNKNCFEMQTSIRVWESWHFNGQCSLGSVACAMSFNWNRILWRFKNVINSKINSSIQLQLVFMEGSRVVVIDGQIINVKRALYVCKSVKNDM